MNNVILTQFLTGGNNPQGENWKPDESLLQPLIDSVRDSSNLIIQHDCFGDKWYPVYKTGYVPNWRKFYLAYHYLINNSCDNAFIVDATDVELLNSPWCHIEDRTLYVGEEDKTISNWWMLENHRNPFLQNFYKRNPNLRLLNCGVIGGTRDTLLAFLELLFSLHEGMPNAGETNSGLFNYAVYNYHDRVVHGFPITTRFRAFEYTDAWFRHK